MAVDHSILTKNNSWYTLLSWSWMMLFFMITLKSATGTRLNRWDSVIQLPTESLDADTDGVGTRWAVLVAGSNGYGNYRHQADVCHAYQLLIKGGLKEENIVVFMYDDIAMNELNPRPGVIINHPQGPDVYAGVPKDYTGESVTTENLYAVILGDKSKVKGGSGKVINSKPEDRIFIYYSDHGGPGVLGMPNMPYLYAMDFIEVLKKKHSAGGYQEMVIYVEACESGSVFEGIMPKDLNVYVTTASNAQESSWGTYCPGMDPSPPPEYITCLGDLYSVAWMEDSETHNLRKETVQQQFQWVKRRTSNFNNYASGSHVMEYGDTNITAEKLYLYQGFDPATVNFPPHNGKLEAQMDVVNQRDAELFFMWQMYKRPDNKPEKKTNILSQISETVKHRNHLDGSVKLIGVFLFGPGKSSSVLESMRAPGLPLVDDWSCLKSMVRVFETHCGSLTQYGMKHMRAFANICNNGVSKTSMEEACMVACDGYDAGKLHPSNKAAFSARSHGSLDAEEQSMIESFLLAHSDLVPPSASFSRFFRESAARTLVQMLGLVSSVDVDALLWEDKIELLDCLHSLKIQHYSGVWLNEAIAKLEELRPPFDATGLAETKRTLQERRTTLVIRSKELSTQLAQVTADLENVDKELNDLVAQERSYEESCKLISLNVLFNA